MLPDNDIDAMKRIEAGDVFFFTVSNGRREEHDMDRDGARWIF